jgi:hypothetical protein
LANQFPNLPSPTDCGTLFSLVKRRRNAKGENARPSSIVVVRNQLFDDRLDANEPDWDGAVDEWCSGPKFAIKKGVVDTWTRCLPPTEGILMVDSRLHNQPALRLQDLLDIFVCSLSAVRRRPLRVRESKGTYFNMLSNKIRDFACESSTVINGTRGHRFCGYDTMCKQDTVIVITKGGGLVDNSCAIRIGNIGVDENPESFGRILRNP